MLATTQLAARDIRQTDTHLYVVENKKNISPMSTSLIRLIVNYFIVEVTGIEPASIQGTNMLSTRLSWPSFSSNSKTQATNYCLIR